MRVIQYDLFQRFWRKPFSFGISTDGTIPSRVIIFFRIFKLPPEEERPIGVWDQRKLRFLREHRPILYTNLKTSGQLHSHLADVEEQANALFLRLVKD